MTLSEHDALSILVALPEETVIIGDGLRVTYAPEELSKSTGQPRAEGAAPPPRTTVWNLAWAYCRTVGRSRSYERGTPRCSGVVDGEHSSPWGGHFSW